MTTVSPSHWARQAAESLARRMQGRPGHVATIATGYGPSGAPHMGTVAEVLRTMMVARLYQEITGGAPIRMLSITDDLDGMRRVPLDDPNREGLERFCGAPLCDIPDLTGVAGSYGGRNAALLRQHLRHFGLRALEPGESLQRLLSGDGTGPDEVLCVLSSDLYRGGHHDAMLRRVAEAASEVVGIVSPELRDARRQTWCPFVPLHEGRMEMGTHDWSVSGDTLVWRDARGDEHRTSVLGGQCKLQWRVDWAMRWVGLEVDLELHGKDLADSVRIGRRLATLLGGRAPVTMQYEMLLDEEGRKISKSVGNGIAIAEWERHAPPAAFRHFLTRDPRRARRVGRQTVSEAVDAWLDALRQPGADDGSLRLVHSDGVPAVRSRLSYATILGVVALADADDPEVVWRLLEGYDPDGVRRDDPVLAALVACAVARHVDLVRPTRTYRTPDEAGRAALLDLAASLRACPTGTDAEAVQYEVYEAGKRHGGKEGLREFFRLVYGVLLGEESGPRLGTLAAAVGAGYLADRLEMASAA